MRLPTAWQRRSSMLRSLSGLGCRAYCRRDWAAGSLHGRTYAGVWGESIRRTARRGTLGGKALSCIWGGEAVRAASCCASLLNAVRGPNAVTCRAPALHALALASAVLARAVRAVSTASSRISYARSTARDTRCATSAAFSEQALRCRTQSRCQWSSRYTCHPLSLAPQSRRRPVPACRRQLTLCCGLGYQGGRAS